MTKPTSVFLSALVFLGIACASRTSPIVTPIPSPEVSTPVGPTEAPLPAVGTSIPDAPSSQPTTTSAPVSTDTPVASPTDLLATPTQLAASPTELAATPTLPEATSTAIGAKPIAVGSVNPTATRGANASVRGGKFRLQLRIDGPGTADFWNTYAGPNDVVRGGPAQVQLLAQSSAGVKVLAYGDVTTTQNIIDLAKSHGIHTIDFNREKTQSCAVLLSEQATAYQLAKQQGMAFVFTPTGVMLRKCYPSNPSMINNADIIGFQTERLQINDPQYATTVKSVVRAIRAIKPGIQVWVQVSANPPANRNVLADEIVKEINSLEDGSPGSPDVINVFYHSATTQPGRVEVMEQVIAALRSQG